MFSNLLICCDDKLMLDYGVGRKHNLNINDINRILHYLILEQVQTYLDPLVIVFVGAYVILMFILEQVLVEQTRTVQNGLFSTTTSFLQVGPEGSSVQRAQKTLFMNFKKSGAKGSSSSTDTTNGNAKSSTTDRKKKVNKRAQVDDPANSLSSSSSYNTYNSHSTDVAPRKVVSSKRTLQPSTWKDVIMVDDSDTDTKDSFIEEKQEDPDDDEQEIQHEISARIQEWRKDVLPLSRQTCHKAAHAHKFVCSLHRTWSPTHLCRC